ncbi:MAG: DNA polymerase III subunit chi, partial [Rhodospirillales bacterium]|nr:DNA polymerase III subunit chi [Rhodospirillales bacterium]
MTDVAFYQLERSPLEQVLPKLLEKTLDAGKRALVVAGSEARIEALNGALWSYYQDSWLPHGS